MRFISQNTANLLISIFFVICVSAPLLVAIITTDRPSSSVEKRNLHQLPKLPTNIQQLVNYPTKINDYYSDHFGFREQLTSLYFNLMSKLAINGANDDVTVGIDNWLFLGSIKPGYQRFGDPIGDSINANLYSEEQLKEFSQTLVSIKNWLKQRNIEYLYTIVPNKHTIYFDKMPGYIKKINPLSATDQLISYIKENTDVTIVDLRKVLLAEKQSHQLYFKSDTHWNHYAANVAQFEILQNAQQLLPQLSSPVQLSDKQFELVSQPGGDLAQFAKIPNIVESNPQPLFTKGCEPYIEVPISSEKDIHTMICESETLNALIFKDSFFIALRPYIARKFHRSTYIEEKINFDALQKYVEKEQPDIVIEEVVERYLPYLPTFSIK